MLILTRERAQTILIGDNIKLTVLAISGGQVRIGIDAPKEVKILRTEIQDRTPSPGATPAG